MPDTRQPTPHLRRRVRCFELERERLRESIAAARRARRHRPHRADGLLLAAAFASGIAVTIGATIAL